MAFGSKIEIEGVDQLVAGFGRYRKEAAMAVVKAIDKTAKAVETDAKMRLKGMMGSAKHWITGTLAKSIYNRETSKGDRIVGTPLEYAPYIEFGAGDYVDIPEGLEAVAAQYKGTKKVKGFKGDSYLNWALVNQSKKMIERIKDELNKIK
jgi:hypothetical protein